MASDDVIFPQTQSAAVIPSECVSVCVGGEGKLSFQVLFLLTSAAIWHSYSIWVALVLILLGL